MKYKKGGERCLEDNIKMVKKVTISTVMLNMILCISKIFFGIKEGSKALVSDGINSFSDVLTTIGVLIGYKLSQRESDDSHPYGHEKFEPVITKILATILFFNSFLYSFKRSSIINQ